MMETVKAHPHYHAPLDGPNRGRGLAYSIWFNIGETFQRAHTGQSGRLRRNLATASPDLSGTRISLAMQAAEMPWA